MSFIQLLFSCLPVFAGFSAISSETFEQDAQVLRAIKDKWNNIPESWKSSDDPCGTPWNGITCNDEHRITQLILSSAGLVGEFPENIGNLTELTTLDLSLNSGLTGNLSPQLGDLSKLHTLTLEYCGFTGNIPSELGNAVQLTYISFFGINLTGEIPSSIGKLSNLKWLDLRYNSLSGSIPISASGNSGLDQLNNLQGLILDHNQLSGSLPQELFGPEKVLTHLDVYNNQLTGEIPDTLYHAKALQAIDLGANSFTGSVSSSINTLTGLTFLGLSNNKFTGPMPDLSGMDSLTDVLLGDNTFDSSEAPGWFTTLPCLTYLDVEHTSLYGPIPDGIFSLLELGRVYLKDNEFNGTLDMTYVSLPVLDYIDLEGNKISEFKHTPDFNKTILLSGNPYCDASENTNLSVCQPFKN